MKPPRFHVPLQLQEGASVEFNAGQTGQIARVLRMQPGDHVEIFDGEGGVALTELSSLTPRHASARVLSVRKAPWLDPWKPMLYLALIRPQRFEWAVEKAAELGAWAIVPLHTARTVHAGERVSAARLRRWQQIAIEAAEQCGSAYVARIEPVQSLREALQRRAALRLLAWEGADTQRASTIGRALSRHTAVADGSESAELSVFVGPEGGFEDGEVEAAVAAGCEPVTLGSRILRTETAALAALTLIAESALSRRDEQ